MDPFDKAALIEAEARPKAPGARNRSAIVVCHSMPHFFETPVASLRDGDRCPPNRTGAHGGCTMVAVAG